MLYLKSLMPQTGEIILEQRQPIYQGNIDPLSDTV